MFGTFFLCGLTLSVGSSHLMDSTSKMSWEIHRTICGKYIYNKTSLSPMEDPCSKLQGIFDRKEVCQF